MFVLSSLATLPSPGVIPLSYRRALHNIKYLSFLSLCLALISQGRGYHRVRNSKRPRLQPRVCLHKHLSSIEVERTCCACVHSSGTPDAMFICSVGNIDVCTIDHIRSWLKSQVHNCFPNPQSTWRVGIWSTFLSTMHHLSRFDTSATLE